MSPTPPRQVQRVAAHAVVRRGGSVLLVRAPGGSGPWSLPGAVVRHGEHPREAVLRGLAEQAGVSGTAPRPALACSDLVDLPGRALQVHTLRLVYEVRVAGRVVPAGRFAQRASLVPTAELAALPLMPYLATRFGLTPGVVALPDPPDPPDPPPPGAGRTPGGEVTTVVQRPAAYAVLVDAPARGTGPPDRLLLTHLTGSGGLWTLPGGGIDIGEDPVAGLTREVHEETGLPYTPGPLLDVLSRHFTGRAPSGRLEDFHGISLLYGGSVPADVEPRVVELGGSTDAAAWYPLPGLGGVRSVPNVHEAVRRWRRRRDR